MKRVYVKEEVCIGCHLCEVYCRLQHAQSKDLVKAFRRELPRPLPRLRIEEKGLVSFSVRCQHCDEAPCMYS
jgi:carbon-monoxide dehydrogenase iron sulfur subunit